MKETLRRALRAERCEASEREKRSAAIVALLYDHPRVRSARTVALFCALPDEPNLSRLLTLLSEAGKTLLLPRVIDGEQMVMCRYTGNADLRVGAFHIMEPVGETADESEAPDVVLVPGMAFDAEGHRLGRGKGYYDRFLAGCPSTVYKIGVCFRSRLLERVPSMPHDIMMDEVVCD